MRTRVVVLACAVVLVALASAALILFDASRAGRLAPGVTVSGVEVGGMEVEAARARLDRSLREPLERPLVVRHLAREFKLSAERSRVRVDVDGALRSALPASRAGNPLSRTWRELRNEPVRHHGEARVSYSRGAVKRMVTRISGRLDRDAVDADVEIGPTEISSSPARAGRRVDAERLERRLHRRLVDFRGDRTVAVRTATVAPAVTEGDLAPRYPAVLIVDRSSFTLTLYKGLKRAKHYDVSVGKAGMETPVGLHRIQSKAIDPDWHVPDRAWAGDLRGKVIPGDDPENAIKTRWMGIHDGAGIHGTDADDSIGSAASHGCIRISDVVELYEDVPVSSPIFIA